MAHSKNDVPFCGGTLRCYCRKVQGHYDAVRQLIDLETTCPHTNQSLYDALMRRKGERPALTPAIEHEIAEIAQKANSDPNAPFQLRCSAASPEAAEKRAEKELMPRVKSIAKLLFRPQWEKLLSELPDLQKNIMQRLSHLPEVSQKKHPPAIKRELMLFSQFYEMSAHLRKLWILPLQKPI